MNSFRLLSLFTALTLSLLSLPALADEAVPPSRAALFQGAFEIRKELRGVHPRILFTPADLDAARHHYQQDPAFFGVFIPPADGPDMSAPAEPVATENFGSRNGTILARASALYILTGEAKYLDRLNQWLPFLESYQPIAFEKLGVGNHDLTSGQLLFCLAVSYDILHGRVDARLEKGFRNALELQARQTYHDLTHLQDFPYEQNHFTIPSSALMTAALVLVDEVPEARDWGIFGANVVRRGLSVLSPDAWFFESFNYWNYTMQYLISGAAALKDATGEDLFQQAPLKDVPLYLAHVFLPDPEFVFDYSDAGPRVEPGGGYQTGYDWPWHSQPTHPMLLPFTLYQREHPTDLMACFLDWETPRMTDLGGGGATHPPAPLMNNGAPGRVPLLPFTGIFHMLWQVHLPEKPVPMQPGAAYPPYHYFPDMEVIHWRSRWNDVNATALAFKSGPPAGHHEATLLPLYPEWKPGLGHAHPDAGTFFLFSKQVFVANGDSEYVGKKETANVNSILVDGIGQAKGGTPWGTFATRPYGDYDKIHMADVWLGSDVAAGTAVFEAAYDPSLQITSMKRNLILVGGHWMVVRDRIESALPHRYEWRIHGDEPFVTSHPDRFVMENGPGRLVMQNLLPAAASPSEPSIVDTELYDPAKPRLQQRGYVLSLQSPAGQKDFSFLTAFAIQGAEEKAKSFKARQSSPSRIDLSDASGSCTVWLEGGADLQGTFAYVLRDAKGTVVSIGLSGQSLRADGLSISLKQAGQVILHAQAKGWSAENGASAANEATVQAKGGAATVLPLPAGA